MTDLSNDDVRALAKASGIKVEEPELTEVAYHLRAIIVAMEAIDEPDIEGVEPLPVPPGWPAGQSGL